MEPFFFPRGPSFYIYHLFSFFFYSGSTFCCCFLKGRKKKGKSRYKKKALEWKKGRRRKTNHAEATRAAPAQATATISEISPARIPALQALATSLEWRSANWDEEDVEAHPGDSVKALTPARRHPQSSTTGSGFESLCRRRSGASTSAATASARGGEDPPAPSASSIP